MKVEFYCGGFTSTETLPDSYTEDDVQDAFDTWLSNRADVGWFLFEGEQIGKEENDKD